MTAKHLVRRAAAVLALLVTMPLGVAGATGRPDIEGTAAKPTIVLVHGAWADASGWAAVTERMEGQGYTVIAPANQLRGVPTDAAYLTSVLASISGPVVLVGHSEQQSCRSSS
jgi:pimeloyl-ACP methyl ester carboxylesterase